MKKAYLLIAGLLLLFTSCDRMIKNNNEKVVNEIDSAATIKPKEINLYTNDNLTITKKQDCLGFWVGNFNNLNKEDYNTFISGDEGLSWYRENKINISIDEISGDKVSGHSVVAGNNRPFEGSINELEDKFIFEISEPGDNQYDGKFSFTILKNDTVLSGTWKAYKKIEISERDYVLNKKVFRYNPDQMLVNVKRYGDWGKSKNIKEKVDETNIEIFKKFSSASKLIYEINASSKLLTKEEVENFKKGDLLIIRNTIYARHGYSFKNRPLRVFFDAQPWYIPVHTDIKSELTEIEKANIILLLTYEKNAVEYYDFFGRG